MFVFGAYKGGEKAIQRGSRISCCVWTANAMTAGLLDESFSFPALSFAAL